MMAKDWSPKSLDDIFANSTVEDILQNDKKRCEDIDLNVMWYHGKMQRQVAEKLLIEAMQRMPELDSDGLFLVRDSTASDVDFSLSFLYEKKCYHFYIERQKEGFFFIEGGPVVHGLEKLIEHYIEAPDRLPTRLSKLCKGTLPPAKVRKDGPTNILHKAIFEKREDLAKKIINHPLRPDLDAKNSNGSTALHDAASMGLDQTVRLLLRFGANIKIKNREGATPLHKACEANQHKVAVLLINQDSTCMQERNPLDSWVPLHTAAVHGYAECANILLSAGAAVYPRDQTEATPIQLAEQYRRGNCVELLANFKELPVDTHRSDWFHPELDRQGAENVFNSQQMTSGLFLIRPNKNIEGQHVLSLVRDRSIFHYEIKTKEYRNNCVHYIDDGPFHQSLEHLVQYYHRFEDGLGVPLRASVSTNNRIKELSFQETYSNLTSPKSPTVNPMASQKDKFKPKLPPRPPDLDSPPPVSAPSLPPTPASATAPTPTTASTPVPGGEEEKEKLKEINTKNLKLGNELGKGEYGSVLKGELVVEKKLFKKEKINVAVKTFHSVGNVEDFMLEAYVMQSLKNDFIVNLLGVCQGPPLMLVEEFVPMGSMLDFLEDHPEKVRVKQELYLWAAQIAQGMMYLETKRLVHRDLAARNILLFSMQRVKISDFGLSRAMGTDKEYYKATKGGRWPIKWYAPESVNFGHFSHASDVWSYGVTLWEMFSYGGAPFEDMTGVEVIKFIEDGNRLTRPTKCPQVVYEVMLRCWANEAAQRPTFSWLNKHFEEEPEYMSAREIMRTVRSH